MAEMQMPPVRADASRDNADEVFDLIDAEDRVIGQVRRGDAHRDPALLHRSVQVLVFGSDDRLVLQHRSRHKDLFPGYYCASASGHVASGEDYATTAAREVREELGVALPLRYLGKTLISSPMESEMTALFTARSDGPFTWHTVETDGGIWVTLDEVRGHQTARTLPMTPALLAALTTLDERLREQPLTALLDG